MNAELMVVPHPNYVVTDESGRFELNDVPPGSYEIVAWHEGWGECGRKLLLTCSPKDAFNDRYLPSLT